VSVLSRKPEYTFTDRFPKSMKNSTSSGCSMQTSGFYGTFMMQGPQKNDCDARATNSQGCGVRSKSKVSYGPACKCFSLGCLCPPTNYTHQSAFTHYLRSQQEEGRSLRSAVVLQRHQDLLLAEKFSSFGRRSIPSPIMLPLRDSPRLSLDQIR